MSPTSATQPPAPETASPWAPLPEFSIPASEQDLGAVAERLRARNFEALVVDTGEQAKAELELARRITSAKLRHIEQRVAAVQENN